MATEPFPYPKRGPSFWRSTPGELDNSLRRKERWVFGASLVNCLLSSPEAEGKSILVLEGHGVCSRAAMGNGQYPY
ncbi:unnamed protein product [Clonostachys solani]|uniref:Uncharacterized protein n=1 Tax=Clonostachys solani TaxID=160281 RepID=A0A9N9Z7M5_9HYPO|nr:unnamed protein product [Clonostachys solani]